MDSVRESDVVEQACGVIAARLEVEPKTATNILGRIADREGRTKDELAADVLASCTRGDVRLPRDLYTDGYDDQPAA